MISEVQPLVAMPARRRFRGRKVQPGARSASEPNVGVVLGPGVAGRGHLVENRGKRHGRSPAGQVVVVPVDRGRPDRRSSSSWQFDGSAQASVCAVGRGFLGGLRELGSGDPVGPGELLQLVAELFQLLAAGHHRHDLFAADLALGEGAVGAAPVEQREAVADRVGVVDVVGDEDDAETARPRLRDVAQHDAGLLDAEGGGRLVEDQHLGAEVDRAGDRHRLPLAAGEGADRLLGVADLDPHLGELVAGDPVGRLDVEAAERPPADRRLRAEEEVARDAHQRDHRQVLVDRGDAGASASRGEVKWTSLPSTR